MMHSTGRLSGGDARRAYDTLRDEFYRRDSQRREDPAVQAELEEIARKKANNETLTFAEQATEFYYDALERATAGREFDFDSWAASMEELQRRFGDVQDLISGWEPFSKGEAQLRADRETLAPC